MKPNPPVRDVRKKTSNAPEKFKDFNELKAWCERKARNKIELKALGKWTEFVKIRDGLRKRGFPPREAWLLTWDEVMRECPNEPLGWGER